ncbi:transporter substrate-binding domain-containing protein, partial [Helicobacter bizzozeronii]|uniref:transporter substrate-binding domain-containing protein n=1 Tax=Helicobacter bizzozeronii TaxID=56877 RepID=UPI001B32BE82
IIGFDIDILDAVSTKVGFNYTLNHMSFDGLIPALKACKIDMIISSMSATQERMKQVDFSIPYYEGETLYIKRKDSA